MMMTSKAVRAAVMFVLAIGVSAVAAIPAYAAGYSASDAHPPIGGYSVKYAKTLSDEDRAGISFDERTCTLTLDNVNVSEPFTGSAIAVTASGDAEKKLTVNLVGNSTIANTRDSSATLIRSQDGWSLTVTGTGSLATDNVTAFAVGGDVRIASGTLDLRSCPSSGGIRCDGTVTVEAKAKLSVASVAPKSGYGERVAVDGAKMRNSYKSLGSIAGRMPVGAEIRDKSALYTVTKLDNATTEEGVAGKMVESTGNAVTLTRWLSGKSAAFTGNLSRTVMGFEYRIGTIAGGAFANKAGAKLRKLTIAPLVKLKVPKGALRGTKGLTDLYLVPDMNYSPLLMDWSYYQASKTAPNALHSIVADIPTDNKRNKSYHKSFLSGVGKANGKKLTVHVSAHRKLYNTKHGKWYRVGMSRVYTKWLVDSYSGPAVGPGKYWLDAPARDLIGEYLAKSYGLSKKAKVVVSASAFKVDWVKTKYLDHFGFKE